MDKKTVIVMNGLTIIFMFTSAVGAGIAIWLNTKSGKNGSIAFDIIN